MSSYTLYQSLKLNSAVPCLIETKQLRSQQAAEEAIVRQKEIRDGLWTA